MGEIIELKQSCDPAALSCRAEPDDEYPRPEPVDPKLIERHRYEDEYDEEEDEENEDDERNYSS
jgi:hypothetical protein